MVRREGRTPTTRTRPLHEKIDHLFRTVRNPDTGKPYTLREAAARLAELGSTRVTHVYLSNLRNGEKTNPNLELITSLAKMFGVEPTYFFDDTVAERVDDQLAALYAMKDLQDAMNEPQIPVLAVRARGLSPKSMGQLIELVDRFRELEGLDPNGDTSTS